MLSSEAYAKIQEISKLYIEIKSIILYVEEIDENASSNLQIIKELRDAFDHVARVFNPTNPPLDEDYIKTNLEKSLGHIYRAGFDALDGCGLSIRDSIAKMLKDYSVDVLCSVISNYWELYAEIEKIAKTLSTCRERKDSGNKNQQVFKDYVSQLNRLIEIQKTIIDKMPAVEECRRKNRKKEFYVLSAYIFGAVGMIVGIISLFKG